MPIMGIVSGGIERKIREEIARSRLEHQMKDEMREMKREKLVIGRGEREQWERKRGDLEAPDR
jgi:hypothetical protein